MFDYINLTAFLTNSFCMYTGKCSHGGLGDISSLFSPKKGINKDDTDSIHGDLHPVAVTVATNATVQLFQDIRAATGEHNFLR